LTLLPAGCSLSPFYLANLPAITRRLPDGIHMDDYVGRDAFGRKVTVGMKLARLGAHPGPDGKLYDLSGRQIQFFRHYDGGMQPPPGTLENAQRELEQLKKTCTVIEILHDPDLPLPV
jgi:hypothetical protein